MVQFNSARCGALRPVVAALALVAAACSTAHRDAEENHWVTYLEDLRRLESDGMTLEPGSGEERLAVERFQSLMADFKAPDFGERIREVYAADVYFSDGLKAVQGVEALEEYLMASVDGLESATVEFLDLAVKDGNYYFRWEMSLRFKKFERGRVNRSVGMSHVRFDRQGKVVLHQDFWDTSGGFFEHVPALGWVLRRIKRRL